MTQRKKKKTSSEENSNKHVIITRTLLVKLNKLTNNNNIIIRLNDVVFNCHELVSDAYAFIKLYLLEEFERQSNLFEHHSDLMNSYSNWLTECGPWRKDFFGHVLSMMTQPLDGKRKGRPFTAENKILLESLQDAYRRFANQGLFSTDIQNRTNLSFVLTYIETSMKTAYQNNIQMHFDKYIKRFIRAIVFKTAAEKHQVERFYDLDYKIQNMYKSLANCSIKWIVYNGAPPDDIEFVQLFKKKVGFALPYPDSNIYEHLDEYSLHLSYMMFMNREIERMMGKNLSPLPLRRQFIPCNIMLDTSALIDIMIDQAVSFEDLKNDLDLSLDYQLPHLTSKGQLYKKPSSFVSDADKSKVIPQQFKTAIWEAIFDFRKPSIKKQFDMMKKKGLVFNNMMTTDGYKIDLQFTDKESYLAERFKKGSILNGAKRQQTDEFKYVQHTLEDERIVFENPKVKILLCDPGKGKITTITDGLDKKNIVTYTCAQRKVETNSKRNRKEYEFIKSNYKLGDGTTIKEVLERKSLCETNSKSCYFETFKQYRLERVRLVPILKEFFMRLCHRRRRLRSRIGKTSSEDKLVNKIVDTFDLKMDKHKRVTNVIIVWGNWGRNPNLKNQPPTPGIGLRRIVDRHIKTYTIDERGTSSYCPECESRVEKGVKMSFVWDKKSHAIVRKKRAIHHLLRCQNEKCASRWWNRDVLATFNQRKQLLSYLSKGTMHEAFKKTTSKGTFKQTREKAKAITTSTPRLCDLRDVSTNGRTLSHFG